MTARRRRLQIPDLLLGRADEAIEQDAIGGAASA
jgi:hypothetical protein